jgi:putative membrane protein
MMYGWDGGMGAGTWILMIVAWIAFIALIVWAIARLFPALSRGDERRREEPEKDETPQAILDRRLARGEIDTGEYERLREALMPPQGARR